MKHFTCKEDFKNYPEDYKEFLKWEKEQMIKNMKDNLSDFLINLRQKQQEKRDLEEKSLNGKIETIPF